MSEQERLDLDSARKANWKRWGPYLSERQWATVREDYSADGNCWDYFPHDHARSRAYRWGEDGLLGMCDRECRLCFAVALWNGKDPILKERLFGLSGPEGNHGEDVKELYYYLDSSPTHSYCKALYKYPHAEYPYARLVEENRNRGRGMPEFEILDTGLFNDGKYFDVFVEYAKNSPDDVLIKITIANRSSEAASLHVLPTLWFRNSWSWGCEHEGCEPKPWMQQTGPTSALMSHATLKQFRFEVEALNKQAPALLFTENETNTKKLWGEATTGGDGVQFAKDAFHEYVIHQNTAAVNPKQTGTKMAAVYELNLKAGETVMLRARLFAANEVPAKMFGDEFEKVFRDRIKETDEFYRTIIPASLNEDQSRVSRQAYAGLLWSKQFYHSVVKDWLDGDPDQPPPPEQRKKTGRNREWRHLFNRDIISMPDKWEYPWYAAWDLAFHMLPMARVDPQFAKEQLVLLLREWYMHPNGQLPAYEFEFSDVNPPVHAWAVWRVYKMTGKRGERDHLFLARCFQKLLINFTWWVNRKDVEGKNIFGGGFLGLDNIGIFDRSKPLPGGGSLEQADGTAWMAFYCGTMLSMALELASVDPAYEDVASKFFEHFIAIVDAINFLGGTGLWDKEDGFYYDQLQVDGHKMHIKIRSLVGVIPLLAVEILEKDTIE
ncbi:MAG: glucosidase, partial [Anaerolineae bacterium]|nr:glucosidase [Phycisphaerae bacterium]